MRFFLIIFSAVGTLLAAIWLRFDRESAFRNVVTQLLGYELRAAVEHYLAGASIPILLAFSFVLLWWLIQVAWNKFKLMMLYLSKKIQYTETQPIDEFASSKALPVAVAVYAVIYFGLSLWYEWCDAFGGIPNKSPHGFIQFEQVAGDFIGIFFSIFLIKKIGVFKKE